MNAVNHTVSRRIVASAEFKNADGFEDLEGCRQTMKQRKENRANKGKLHEYATLRGCGLDGRIPRLQVVGVSTGILRKYSNHRQQLSKTVL